MKRLKSILVILCLCVLFAACRKLQGCNHTYAAEITQAASCTQAGEQTFTCTVCQHSYTEPIPLQEHNYGDALIEKEPTCSEEGLQKFNCAVCGAEKSESIEKLPHTLENSTVIKEPNCTEEGQSSGDCVVCGAKQVTAKIATNDVHVFSQTVVRAATCTEPGEGTNVCSLCQYSEPCQFEKKGHTYSKQTILTKASCTKDGEVQNTCADCGYSAKETIAAPGHNWTGATCLKEGVCAVCGIGGNKADHTYTTLKNRKASENFAGYREMKCSVCGDEKDEYYTQQKVFDLNAIGEEIVQYAKGRGIQARIEYIESPRYKFTMPVWQAERLNYGPDTLIKNGKKHVDWYYDSWAATPAGIGAYTMLIYVYYTESGAVGSGYFGVCAKATF